MDTYTSIKISTVPISTYVPDVSVQLSCSKFSLSLSKRNMPYRYSCLPVLTLKQFGQRDHCFDSDMLMKHKTSDD